MMGGFHGTDPGLYGSSEVEESLIRTEKKKKSRLDVRGATALRGAARREEIMDEKSRK